VDDPAFPSIAREVEDVARALLERAAQQTDRAQQVHDAAVTDGASATIEDIPSELSPAQILARWRDADRRLAALDPTSSEARTLRGTIDGLRAAYHRAYRRDA
jgi:hypothetical protein